MKNRIFTVLLLIPCISFLPLKGKEKKSHLKFKLKSGYNFLSSAAPGEDLISSINSNMPTLFKDVGFLDIYGATQLQRRPGTFAIKGEIELSLNQRISLALGLEYFAFSDNGYFHANSTIPGYSYNYYQKHELGSKLLPITFSARYYLLIKKFQAYMTGGIGYYIETLRHSAYFKDNWEEKNDTLYKARGTAFIPHIGGGIGYSITKHILLSLELGCPIGKINSFKIVDSSDYEKIGEQVTFSEKNGTEIKYSHNLTALNFGIFIALAF